MPERAVPWLLPTLILLPTSLGIAAYALRRWREAGTHARDVTDEDRTTATPQETEAGELRTLSRSLVRLQEEERAAIARELHDEIGQALSCQILSLTLLQREAQAVLTQAAGIDTAPASVSTARSMAAHAAESLRIAETLLDSMHQMVMRLRPSVLDHLGLIPALQQLISALPDRELNLSLETVGLPAHARFTPETETALYRVVQEALTNVRRHAVARRVDIVLERPPDLSRGDRLILLIEDDGVGFDPDTAMRSSRLGLLGMRERVEALGGVLTVESSLGRGTTILVEIPYAQACPIHAYTDS